MIVAFKHGSGAGSKPRPRVCLISHIYFVKGHRRKLELLSKSVDLHVIMPDSFPLTFEEFDGGGLEGGPYHTHLCRSVIPFWRPSSTRWVLLSRDLWFRELNPDIIHVENEQHSNIALQALLYRRLFAPQARTVLFSWANQRISGIKGVATRAMARLVRDEIDFYIAGNYDGRVLLENSGVSSDRIEVFPAVGVDANRFCPVHTATRCRLRQELGIDSHEFVVGFVGRFVEGKGIPDLTNAFLALRSRLGPGEKMRLLLVGAGPLSAVLASSAPEGQSSISVVGHQKLEGVVKYMQAMDTLVLPSRTMPFWKEQFGRVLVEAMACGVPVVGSDSGEIPRVIGEAGLVFPEGSVSALAARLWDLYSNPPLRWELSQRGRQRVLENYTDERMVEQTVDIYRRLMANK